MSCTSLQTTLTGVHILAYCSNTKHARATMSSTAPLLLVCQILTVANLQPLLKAYWQTEGSFWHFQPHTTACRFISSPTHQAYASAHAWMQGHSRKSRKVSPRDHGTKASAPADAVRTSLQARSPNRSMRVCATVYARHGATPDYAEHQPATVTTPQTAP